MRHFDNLQYGWRVGTDEGGRKSNVSGRLFAFLRIGEIHQNFSFVLIAYVCVFNQ